MAIKLSRPDTFTMITQCIVANLDREFPRDDGAEKIRNIARSLLRERNFIGAENAILRLIKECEATAEDILIYGNARYGMRDYQASSKLYTQVCEIVGRSHPKYHEVRLMAAYSLLTIHHVDGWKNYESRKHAWARPQWLKILDNAPQWDGKPCSQKKVVVYCEMGYGDTIMMSRYFSTISSLSGHLIVAAQPNISRLLENLFPFAEIVSEVQIDNSSLFISDMSLPTVLGDGALFAQRIYLPVVNKNVKNVGITWNASKSNNVESGAMRSIPFSNITEFISYNSDVNFHCLSPLDMCDLEGQKSPSNLSLCPDGDFHIMAEIIKKMDLVITIDSAPAHLAATLGKPTWIMLPYHSCWRWGKSQTRTPLYPTALLFRQQTTGEWRGVIEEVQRELSNLMAS